MKNLITNLINTPGITPPDIINMSFTKNFPGALNIEWYNRNNQYESVFYKDNIEHIAIFDNSGVLIEYKQFLPDGFAPVIITDALLQLGEIMNLVLINKGNDIVYEAILRNHDLSRFVVVVNIFGKIINRYNL